MAGDLKTPPKLQADPFAKVFSCKGCGASVRITALGQSLMAVCSACGTAVDATDENLTVLTKFRAKPKHPPVIALGTRGKLHGTLWECIGFMERSDTKTYYWHEYLLFNPQKGFRWLSENSGHWSWIKTTKSAAKDNYQSATYLSKSYKLFHHGTARIEYIAGEFYWRAMVGDKASVKDFISPPEILSFEMVHAEITWSLGEYIDGHTVKHAFKIKDMPSPIGVAPNQPWDKQEKLKGIGGWWAFFFTIMVLLQFLLLTRSPATKVFEENYQHNGLVRDPGVNEFVTSQFELKGRTKNLDLILHAPVDNSWFEAEVELINDETGDSLPVELGVEYYHGHDGEYWSEGSKTNSHLMNNVPNGKYHLNISSTSPPVTGAITFRITAVRGVTTWTTFLFYLFWITLFPLLIFWRQRSFEMKRWVDSDFSPYHGQDDDE